MNKEKKTLSIKKNSEPDEFTAEFYQTFQEEITPKLLKLFHKMGKEHFQTHSTAYYPDTKKERTQHSLIT
jgi:hypothetical protein